MSPLTLKKIKEAQGRVRVKQEDGLVDHGAAGGSGWAVQILESGTWKTIYRNRERTVCEEAISKASQQVILG